MAVGDVVPERWRMPAVQAAVNRRPRRPGLVRARAAVPLLDATAPRRPRRGPIAPPRSRLRVTVQHDGLCTFWVIRGADVKTYNAMS